MTEELLHMLWPVSHPSRAGAAGRSCKGCVAPSEREMMRLEVECNMLSF